jgi:phage terminase large subunit-like protein
MRGPRVRRAGKHHPVSQETGSAGRRRGRIGLRSLSADARRAHGLSPTLWVYDEMAQAKSRELLDNLTTAMGKRARSLGIVISTQAPRDDHPLSQLIDDGLSGADPGVHVHSDRGTR